MTNRNKYTKGNKRIPAANIVGFALIVTKRSANNVIPDETLLSAVDGSAGHVSSFATDTVVVNADVAAHSTL